MDWMQEIPPFNLLADFVHLPRLHRCGPGEDRPGVWEEIDYIGL